MIYSGCTILHYLFDGFGIIIGYNFLNPGWLSSLFGLIYIIFAFVQMYVIMPLTVCPNCVYYKMKDSVCTSGLNLVSRRLAKPGDIKNFSRRAEGAISHNKLYMDSLFIPVVFIIIALILNFSVLLLALFLTVLGLFMLRYFVIFKRVACVHCALKHRCPNAKAMGIV